jgi:hypothetical protein
LFTEHFNWQPKLDGLSFDSIDEVDAIWLERAFEKEDVLEVVKAMNSDKAWALMFSQWRSFKPFGMQLK